MMPALPRLSFRRLVRDTRANVAITFALVGLLLMVLVFMAVDISNAYTAKNALQDATDAAALAAATEVAKNPNETVAQLKKVANSMLKADFSQGAPSISAFHVCAAVQKDCTGPNGQLPMNTVMVGTDANVTCLLFGLSSLCGTQGAMIPVNASTTTSINLGVTMQLNILMDSSASMIVGATQTDVNTISTWVSNNWAQVKPGDPAPYTGGDNPPCAFACHDVGGNTQPSDIAQGLTNAHAAGATTRFDVMIQAAQGLIGHLQTEQQQATGVQNTMLFNVMSFDTSLHTYGASNTNFAGALTAIGQVSPGLDTWMATAMGQVITQVGVNGAGTSASPYKFLILVTDGLQSDRSNNWTCTSWVNDAAWNYNPTCVGGYATSINVGQCAQLKSNGVIVAVLETPYVPLTGQDPNVQPYEKTVRKVIYPGGPGSQSSISQALSTCASPGYYFQAASSSQIATGFTTLTDKFINDATRIVN
jgi:Flp pilus assembly protein TadG